MTKLTAASKDGTAIAYERAGNGPAVVLVGGGLTDRSENGPLVPALTECFTVVNYDRRGRGASNDAADYDVGREVEDIDALIAAMGGTAHLYGVSSGGAPALEAAAAGSAVGKVAVYEVPYNVAPDLAPGVDVRHRRTRSRPRRRRPRCGPSRRSCASAAHRSRTSPARGRHRSGPTSRRWPTRCGTTPPASERDSHPSTASRRSASRCSCSPATSARTTRRGGSWPLTRRVTRSLPRSPARSETRSRAGPRRRSGRGPRTAHDILRYMSLLGPIGLCLPITLIRRRGAHTRPGQRPVGD